MRGFANKSLRLVAVSFGLLASASVGRPADLSLLPLTGNLLGSVINAEGIPQRGATVLLFDRLGRLRSRVSSQADGRFGFADLPADLYSVRVTLAAYLPAISDQIAIRPGLDSMLQVHLATLLSSIELKYSLPTGAMSNDWKWVLRSSPATRPITRFRTDDGTIGEAADHLTHVFSETHAAVSLSGGDSSLVDTDAISGSAGTGFALSTNILGRNQLRLIGSLGQTPAMYPGTLGFSAFYSRQETSTNNPSPELTVTMTQLGLVNGPPSPPNAQLAVRTISFSLYQAIDLPADTRVEYGASVETVGLFEYSTRSNPYARITRSLGKAGEIIASVSDGSRPDALLQHSESDVGIDRDSQSIMGRIPELSYRNGRIEIQRSLSSEIGYRKGSARRGIGITAYKERVSNGRLDVAGDRSQLNANDLMSDGTSATSIFNIGNFGRSGVLISADQSLSSFLTGTVSYGRLGGFTTAASTLGTDGSLAGFLRPQAFDTANAGLRATLRRSGTRVVTSYGWVDGRAIIPQHVFTTQPDSADPGMNVSLRQPLPSLFGMPGHLEIRADLRNLLAQGYLPVDAGNGRTLLLLQAPRAVRGSVNFTF